MLLKLQSKRNVPVRSWFNSSTVGRAELPCNRKCKSSRSRPENPAIWWVSGGRRGQQRGSAVFFRGGRICVLSVVLELSKRTRNCLSLWMQSVPRLYMSYYLSLFFFRYHQWRSPKNIFRSWIDADATPLLRCHSLLLRTAESVPYCPSSPRQHHPCPPGALPQPRARPMRQMRTASNLCRPWSSSQPYHLQVAA
jgi:hypothetical protein